MGRNLIVQRAVIDEVYVYCHDNPMRMNISIRMTMTSVGLQANERMIPCYLITDLEQGSWCRLPMRSNGFAIAAHVSGSSARKTPGYVQGDTKGRANGLGRTDDDIFATK